MKRYAKTAREAAETLGMARDTVEGWIQRSGLKKGPKGYDVQALKRWRDENMPPPRTKKGDPASPGDSARLLKAQADQREALAALADLKLQIEKGQYRSIQEIEVWDRSRSAIVKRGLLGLPRSLGPLLVGLQAKEIESVLMQKVRGLLEAFAGM